jgi:MFS family permease
MQALAHSGLLKRFDYLSTVSGGGYIGSAITWLVSDLAGDSYRARRGEKQTGKGPKFGLNKNDFPFGCDDPAPDASRSDDPDQKKMLSYLRQHGNYLAPGAGISLFSLVGVILRGMLLNLFVWIPVFILFFLALLWIPEQFAGSSTHQGSLISQLIVLVTGMLTSNTDHFLESKNLFIFNGMIWIALWILAALLAITWLSSLATWLRRARNRQSLRGWYHLRRSTEKAVAFALPFSILLLLTGTLPLVATVLHESIAAAPVAILTGATFLLRGFLTSFTQGKGLPTGFLVPLAAGLFLYGVILFSFQIAYLHFPSGLGSGLLAFSLFVFAFITGWFVNLNYISIHRFYRDRLMETFMPDIFAALNQQTGAANDADGATLQSLGNREKPRGPYHIVNTNVVLVNSLVDKYEDRGDRKSVV